jgi:hypothetical protein
MFHSYPVVQVKQECLSTVGALGDIDVEICSRWGGAVIIPILGSLVG